MQNANEVATQCEDTLASVLGLAMHFLKTLSFNRKNPQQLYSVCLYTGCNPSSAPATRRVAC